MHYGQLLNEAIEVRRFAIVGHRAMSKGKLPLNDLAGGAGRMDVLIRAVMSSLLTSHGLRENGLTIATKLITRLPWRRFGRNFVYPV